MLIPVKDQDPEAAARLRVKVLADIRPHELEMVLHICNPEQYTNERIAGLMHVTPDTLDGYVRAFNKRFGIVSKHGIVIFAFLWALHDLPPPVDAPRPKRVRRHPPNAAVGAAAAQARP